MSQLRDLIRESKLGGESRFHWRGDDVSRLEGLTDAALRLSDGNPASLRALVHQTEAVGAVVVNACGRIRCSSHRACTPRWRDRSGSTRSR